MCEYNESEENKEDRVVHHKIEWSTVPNLNEKLKTFRFDTIWKHIFCEE